ncbi:MAG: PQQ-binding-like beta-propeller repeat protein [Methanotrichaceae archaeon]
MKKLLLLALISLLAIAVVSAQDWQMTNYDNAMSRHSPQTIIGKNNVNQLQVKWILNTNNTIENPPLIVGNTGYTQVNALMQVIAFDLNTGLTKWKYTPVVPTIVKLPRSTTSHGITYENGIIYAPTGGTGTIVALNASTGKKIWESQPLRPLGGAFRISAPPLIWKNYVVAGSALGDLPPFGFPERGSLTGLDKKTGKMLWQIPLAVGAWVTGALNNSTNGGADAWTGGAIDTDKGIVYIPVGNAAPDFDASTRPGYNNYSSNVIAVNITNGKILWATPFVAKGSIFNATYPDTHDWDTAWGTNLITVNMNGTQKKIVIGHDKRGDIAALDAATGKPIWWRNLAVLYNVNAAPTKNGTTTWPGPGSGIEDFTAFDNNTIYAAVSNQGMTFFNIPGMTVIPDFKTMTNGIGNGSIVALDIKTGNIKWQVKTEFPTWCSPLVTNGVVFAGHVTSMGVPYNYSSDFGGPTETPQISSGILMALDADTGKELWEFNVGAQVAIGGPSIGNGMLLVPTGGGQTTNAGGYIVAFGLPGNMSSNMTSSTMPKM